MSQTLHDLLESDEPVAMCRIEEALKSSDVQNEAVDPIISALIWRRCTTGKNGVLGAIIEQDCAARIDVLADHLEYVGASDAAKAARNLRGAIPLDDQVIRNGIIDWIDANPEFIQHAQGLNDETNDVAVTVWSHMQERKDELPDPVIPEKERGFFSRMFGG